MAKIIKSSFGFYVYSIDRNLTFSVQSQSLANYIKENFETYYLKYGKTI